MGSCRHWCDLWPLRHKVGSPHSDDLVTCDECSKGAPDPVWVTFRDIVAEANNKPVRKPKPKRDPKAPKRKDGLW